MRNTISLGEVAEFIRGVTFKPEQLMRFGEIDSLVCMRTKNVQFDLDQSDLISIPTHIVKNDKKMLREGDLLVSTANSFELVGKASWVPKLAYPATAGGFIAILRANPKKLYERYLYHWVVSGATQHALRYCGRQTTNISNLSIERALELKIPLPPLVEQKRIAAILDKADSIRRKRQQAIDLAGQFLRSVFLDMFGDPAQNKSVQQLLDEGYLLLHKDGNHGGNYPRKEEFGKVGVPFITAKDINDAGVINRSSVVYLNENKARSLTIGWLETGDVLLAHNATVGKVGLFSDEFKEALIGTSLTAYRPNKEKLTPQYLFAALRFSSFQEQLKKNMGQTTRNQVPIMAQRRLKVPIAPVEKQNEFERIYNQVLQSRYKLVVALQKSEDFFCSLAQRAFKGELTQGKAA